MKKPGRKFLHLWNKTQHYHCNRMPLPIRTALSVVKDRHDDKTIEDTIYRILKKDPEIKEVIKFLIDGSIREIIPDEK